MRNKELVWLTVVAVSLIGCATSASPSENPPIIQGGAAGSSVGGNAGQSSTGNGGVAGSAGGGQAQGGSAGLAGQTGAAGQAGAAGTGGSAGQAGAAGTGGSAGQAGAAGTGGSAETGGSAGSGGYTHTITIDGTNDFTVNDTFTTTSNGYTGYISWDSQYMYFGMDGVDVGNNDGTKWFVVYLGVGGSGSRDGVQLGSQQPHTSTPFGWSINWKGDNSLTRAMVFNGTSWIDGSWSFTGDVYQSGSFVELRVPLAKLGNPSTIRVHLNMVNESNGGEWTYAGVPSTSFQDGLDPDYGKFFSFDLTSAKAPKDYLPQ